MAADNKAIGLSRVNVGHVILVITNVRFVGKFSQRGWQNDFGGRRLDIWASHRVFLTRSHDDIASRWIKFNFPRTMFIQPTTVSARENKHPQQPLHIQLSCQTIVETIVDTTVSSVESEGSSLYWIIVARASDILR